MQTESKEESVWHPICPVKVQSKSNENQKINQKLYQKTDPCKRLRCISDNPWAFFDLSSVAAGLQSARQQWKWRMKNEEWRMKNCRLRRLRNKVRRPEGKPIIQFRVYCPKESKCPRTCKIRLKSPLSCQGSIKRKSKYKSKENQKTNPCKDSVENLW